MAKRYVYIYFMQDEPEKIREIVPAHIAYWNTSNLENYVGGPFGDRTGGLIMFDAPGLGDAMALIAQDPFILENLLEMKWIKEWIPEESRHG